MLLCILSPGALGPQYFREMAAILSATTPEPARMKGNRAALYAHTGDGLLETTQSATWCVPSEYSMATAVFAGVCHFGYACSRQTAIYR